MARPRIVQLPCEKPEESVLLRMTTKGTEDLDFDLVGTEGEAVYRGKGEEQPSPFRQALMTSTVRRRKISNLKSKSSDVSIEDLEAILRYTFLSKRESGISDEQRASLEALASVNGKKDKTLVITFQNRIGGITQRIATIELAEADADEESFIEWTKLAVARENAAEDRMVTLEAEIEAYKKKTEELEATMSRFVKAKSEYEKNLFAKFALLLNEKKVKIRNQQRILKTSDLKPAKLEELHAKLDRNLITSHASQGRKRGKEENGHSADDSSDGFEAMEVDRLEENSRSRSRSRSSNGSTERTASVDGSDDDDDSGEALPEPISADTRTAGLNAEHRTPVRDHQSQATRKTHLATAARATKIVHEVDDEATASEDDEL